VLDLYAREWDGKPLGPNDYVISADEKTSIQARCRCHPTLPPGKARMMRVNHDYHRRGAIAYLAAYDVHRARVHGRCQDTTGIVPFTALVEQVMTQEPLQVGQPGVLGRGQRLLAPRPEGDRPARRTIPQRGHGAHPGTRVLAESSGNLLLDCST
jgi:hypothetical protein